MRFILFIILLLINGCSSSQTEPQLSRFPAQTDSQKKLSDCFSQKRRYCSHRHPYELIKKKFLEFEYQYLNRRNKVHILYNDCVSREALNCTKRYAEPETIERFSNLHRNMNTERMLQNVENNTFTNNLRIPFMDLSPEQIKRVFKTVHTLKKAYVFSRDKIFQNLGWVKDKSLDSMHGMGVSLSGQAFLGLGGTLQYEAVIHNRKMALFCAPGVTAQTDIGISADVGVIKTLGCETNESYAGKFLAVNAGVSGEAIGLPFNVGANYSLGMGVSEFLAAMAKLKKEEKLKPIAFARELAAFVTEAYPIMRDRGFANDEVFAALMLSKVLSQTTDEKTNIDQINIQLKEHIFYTREKAKDKVLKITPLAYHIKTILKLILLMEQEYNMELSQFRMVVNELDKSLDHCDAIGLTGGVSLTLSPINAGVTVFQYVMMTQINIDDVIYLSSFAPKALLTLKLGKVERERFTRAVTNILKIIPELYNNRCAEEAQKRFSKDALNLWDLI